MGQVSAGPVESLIVSVVHYCVVVANAEIKGEMNLHKILGPVLIAVFCT